MNDPRYLYLFIRQDLPLSQQIVQTNHATFALSSIRKESGCPNIVLIGVPNVKSLERVRSKLQAHQVPHYCWEEPDYDFGFTAIATAPLTEEEKKPLGNYRLWRPVQGAAIPHLECKTVVAPGENQCQRSPATNSREIPGASGNGLGGSCHTRGPSPLSSDGRAAESKSEARRFEADSGRHAAVAQSRAPAF